MGQLWLCPLDGPTDPTFQPPLLWMCELKPKVTGQEGLGQAQWPRILTLTPPSPSLQGPLSPILTRRWDLPGPSWVTLGSGCTDGIPKARVVQLQT